MKKTATYLACFIIIGTVILAPCPAISEFVCSPGTGQLQDTTGICADPENAVTQAVPESSLLLLISLQTNFVAGRDASPATGEYTGRSKITDTKIIIYFFRGDGCPHCEEEKIFLDDLKRKNTFLQIKNYEVWYNRENAGLMALMLRRLGVQSSGVPVTFIHDRMFSGFAPHTRASIEKVIEECGVLPCGDPAAGLWKAGQPEQVAEAGKSTSRTDSEVAIPVMGTLDVRNSSLPLLTLVIAGMDSFNPCAFFVLLSLLGLLVHAQSRNKMFLIGGVFVFFSGFIYFIFMAAWLNLFLFMGHVTVITMIAGIISVLIAGINIKDFFLFKQGVSLSIPDSAKPKLFDRMRKLLRSTRLVPIMIGTTVLAVVANSYELLCTAGFPMVFTRILTLSSLSTTTYYLYLVLYNIIYIVPLLVIVLGFTLTLGKRQLSEWQGRVLKLVSGVMMLGLGSILLINPALLNSVMVSFIILVAALAVSFVVVTVTKRLGH